MSKIDTIFIVGSSRSGTTMMGRILANNTAIFTFRELHFFGTIWTNDSIRLNKKSQVTLLSRLFCIQKYGVFNQNKYLEFNSAAEKLIKKNVSNPLEIYKLFLKTVTVDNSAQISCEQTPKNLYYLEEILNFFPNAKVINLVRDQRDVLLSQKNKWKRRFLGAKAIPFSEVIRSYFNYHPIITSRVWNSALLYTSKYLNHPKVKIVKFEDLLVNSEDVIKDICNFLQIDFQKEMLRVPLVGSSIVNDTEYKFQFDPSKINKWEKGGLSDAEIYLSQKFSAKMMNKFNYKIKPFFFPPIRIIFYILSFPLILVLAFVFNIHRAGNILEVIKKRFFVK